MSSAEDDAVSNGLLFKDIYVIVYLAYRIEQCFLYLPMCYLATLKDSMMIRTKKL